MADTSFAIPFSLGNPWKFPVTGMPLRCSVPLPPQFVTDPACDLVLVDEAGGDCAAQWRVLSRWPDGSARFALMDFAEGDIAPRARRRYTLQQRTGQLPVTPRQTMTVQEDAQTITVDTGRLAWTFSKTRFSFAESLTALGRDWVAGQSADLIVTDQYGQCYRASEGEYRITLEENGPYRVIVLIQGDFRNPQGRFFTYWMRLHFVAGGTQVLMSQHLRNREPGRQGRDVRRCSLVGSINARPVRRLIHTVRTVNTISAPIEVPENVDIDIDDRICALRNPASLREDPQDICGTFQPHGEMPGGNRAVAPLIDLHEAGVGGLYIAFAMPNPSLEAPMRLASDRNAFEIDFFPQTAEPHHFGEGMGKTRDVLFNIHDDSLEMMDLYLDSGHLDYPGVTGVPHEVYRAAQFADVHRTLVRQPNKYPLLESKIEFMKAPGDIQNKQAIKAHPLLQQIAGWKNFGDYVGLRGHMPRFQHVQYGNNEEDYLYCAMLDAWRTGRPYDGRDMARHVMDIDFIDYSTDPGRDGAVCPHAANHTDGEVYTSHQWCQGLLYYYLGTGDEEALRIAKRIGDCLICWITGPRSYSIRISGRESAWPLLSLAALYDVTGEEKYRDAGMIIINSMFDAIAEHGQMVWEYPWGTGVFSSYMLAMTFNGVWDMYAATGDERILEMWKLLTTPTIESLTDPNSKGYVHFRNAHLMWADLTVLVRWYELTGDPKYIELGKNGLRLVLAACPEPLIQSDSIYAMGYRHFILFLKNADEFGMIDDNHVTLVW